MASPPKRLSTVCDINNRLVESYHQNKLYRFAKSRHYSIGASSDVGAITHYISQLLLLRSTYRPRTTSIWKIGH